jgi:hypothetical protein
MGTENDLSRWWHDEQLLPLLDNIGSLYNRSPSATPSSVNGLSEFTLYNGNPLGTFSM